VREAVTGGSGEAGWREARLLERFWFDGDAQWAPINLLSGGERRRLQLLLVLAEQPNVLLLDEPTNDLDLDTLRALEDFLEEWPGALIVVSHDRAFLERTVDDVVVLDGEGRVGRRPGGYAAWEAERRAQRITGTLRAPAQAPGSAAPVDAVGSRGTDRAVRRSPSLSTLKVRIREVERGLAPLERRRAELEHQLATAIDHRALAALGEELATVTEQIGALEERWLELSAQLESAG
jgi:ATP-binding cassette subfamily F protein uup